MKISIITVCYNSERTIEDTIKSVLNQSYKNFEFLIIDGKSSDNTMQIVSKYKKNFGKKLKVLSEKDNGLYDAMNKGIRLSTGDIIGIINSDDILANNSVFYRIIEEFEKTNSDAVYSNLRFMDYDSMKIPVRNFNAGNLTKKFGWHPPHPTFYVLTKIYNELGYYNTNYKIAADYDFMLRVIDSNSYKISYINDYLVYMRSGGLSTNGLKGYYNNFKESCLVLKNNKRKFPILTSIYRIYINVIKQYFNRKR
jgi:glycosyltransferase involved in cell wall biosynthesis